MSKRAVLLAVTFLLAGGRLLAQVPAEERIPIRDPDRLQALGFPRDSMNVYVWSRAESKGRTVLEQKAVAKSGITGGCGGGNYCPDAP
jgi:hypothetical protein